jgi:hypothetical protein
MARTAIEHMVDALERTSAHLTAIYTGAADVGPDLATTLHLLVGEGDGYGWLAKALEELEIDPRYPLFEVGLGGDDVVLHLRSDCPLDPEEPPAYGTLDRYLDETCVRWAIPGVEPTENHPRRKIIKWIRNKYGSHMDKKPAQWLDDLRVYPAGDRSALTYLAATTGRGLLENTVPALVTAGALEPGQVQVPGRYMSGIDVSQAIVTKETQGRYGLIGHVRAERWSGRSARSAVVGAVVDDMPMIFGIEAAGQLTLFHGEAGTTLEQLERDFRARPASPPVVPTPNRSERRRQQRERRRGK